MYIAVLGKTPRLSCEELLYAGATNLKRTGYIATFSTDTPEKLAALGGCIKRGKLYENLESAWADISSHVKDIIGVSDIQLGMELKKAGHIKRFKVCDIQKSDQEVKACGVELIDAGHQGIGVITSRQDIKRFETIDFDKKVRGMQVGMMPAKLTQMLVHIGLAHSLSGGEDTIDIPTVYDPFCGFGTTNFVANSLGYHSIGSDINITPAKQNLKRRQETAYHQNEARITFFKHDVTQVFTKPFLQHTTAIASEGWLGPVISKRTRTDHLEQHADAIVGVYSNFFHNLRAIIPHVPLAITSPDYTSLPNHIPERIAGAAQAAGYDATLIGELYKRPKQLVGRRVVLCK